MKLLQIVNNVDIKELWQIWFKSFFLRKQDQE